MAHDKPKHAHNIASIYNEDAEEKDSVKKGYIKYNSNVIFCVQTISILLILLASFINMIHNLLLDVVIHINWRQ